MRLAKNAVAQALRRARDRPLAAPATGADRFAISKDSSALLAPAPHARARATSSRTRARSAKGKAAFFVSAPSMPKFQQASKMEREFAFPAGEKLARSADLRVISMLSCT